MRKPKSERQLLILANDKLFSAIIHARDKVCQVTGRTEHLQVCHYWTRDRKRVRWDLENACLLVASKHIWWAHKEPAQFKEFWIRRLGQERFDNLELRARYAAPVKREYLQMMSKWLRDMLETKKEDVCK